MANLAANIGCKTSVFAAIGGKVLVSSIAVRATLTAALTTKINFAAKIQAQTKIITALNAKIFLAKILARTNITGSLLTGISSIKIQGTTTVTASLLTSSPGTLKQFTVLRPYLIPTIVYR